MTSKPSERYENPLVDRWGAPEMSRLFSPQFKHVTWRRLWVWLAEAEKELGLPISDEQLAEMKAHLEDIDFARAAQLEKQTRHDVVAHIRLYQELCPKAGPIIHAGATSCFVTDNTELIQMREGLRLIARRLAGVLDALARFAARYADLPTLAFTHYQPAQPTTVGKRAALWAQDFLLDLQEVERWSENLPFRGAKGATGTQASFLKLFDGDHEKVERLDRLVAAKAGFARVVPVTGQTYPRKLDAWVLGTLSQIGASAAKFATDLRLLQGRKELEEPFGKDQVGSSAMPYKRNPMRCERLCGIARHLLVLSQDALHTAASQWLERTLDDSSNRRIAVGEAFLAADVVLRLAHNVAAGIVVLEKMIQRHLGEELPFLVVEDLLMAAVKKGGDRQRLHEKLRRHAQQAGDQVKLEGGKNDLLERLEADPDFAAVKDELRTILEPSRYVGRAPEQTRAFLEQEVKPALARYSEALGEAEEPEV